MNRALSTILRAAIIAGAVWFVYAPAFHGGWFWDDPAEIVVNASIRTRAGLLAIWTAPGTPDYYPLKQTLQWVQWHLWGQDVTGYHLTNVALHLFSCLLFWRILSRLGARQAWLGGLLFAIHPVAVESVAWISELKNVLSLPLMLMAFLAYLNWDEGETRLPGASLTQSGHRLPSAPMRRAMEVASHLNGSYTASLLLFLAAMLCKSSVVMFPFVLLLYAWWRRGGVTRADLRAVAPFLIVSLALGFVTIWFQENVAIKGIVVPQGGALSRMAVAGMAVAFYLSKCAWPAELLPIYPRWAVDPPHLWQFWPWPVLAVLLLGLWSQRGRDWARHLLFGLGFFILNLAPVLGFIPMSFLRISWVADHFAYLPLLGLAGLAAAGVGAIGEMDDRPARPGLPGQVPVLAWFVLAGAVSLMAFAARGHAAIFGSEKEAWTYTLARNPDAWLARNNLSNIFLTEGRIDEATEQIEEALRLKPDFAEAHNNYGNILLQVGRAEEARPQFEAAIRLRSGYAEAHNGLGNYYLKAGHPDRAADLYREALAINPDYYSCRDNLGAALESMGRPLEAIGEYQRVIREKPDYAAAYYNLGIALMKIGDREGAIAACTRAIQLDPGMIQAYNNLGNALLGAHRTGEAIQVYQKALAVQPEAFEVHFNLGNALYNARRFGEAVNEYRKACHLNPGFAVCHNSLGMALAAVGRGAEAQIEFMEALRIDPGFTAARENLGRTQHGR